jgi:hypothetical protein
MCLLELLGLIALGMAGFALGYALPGYLWGFGDSRG